MDHLRDTSVAALLLALRGHLEVVTANTPAATAAGASDLTEA